MRTRFLLGVTLAFLGGCGDGGPSLVPVSGTATVNGKPLEGASILFVPEPNNKLGLVGLATSGPSGSYTAVTNNQPGLVPGNYKVKVRKVPPGSAPVAAEFKDDPHMAMLVTQGPEELDERKKKPSPGPGWIEGEVDREIPSKGGVIDIDVKMATQK
ncbi:MAG: carboxypeptidase-like regulatory domain-containing protein [Isosphaeraceae bacterium]|nr:carboxypeptidase-like regulatory domain-containing protein [Isosphaeraceae bacterium]